MRKLIPAVVALLAAGASHALGFGELTLQSALNQPFDASVTLLAVKPSERDSVEVRIAEPETFERFGVARSAALDDIEVGVRPAGGDRMRVELRSRRPVREPFVTLLLVADWDGGRALREYTVLLDPPVEAPATRAESKPEPAPARDTAATGGGAESGQGARPAASPEPAPAPRTTANAEPEPTPQRAPSPPAAPAERVGAEEPSYRRYGPVAPDETLWSIAYELRPDPAISMDQMLLAIYQSNPQAFEGNINRMRAGTMLIIPDAEEIRQIDRTVARQEIADQKREYARSGPGTAASARAEADDASRPQPTGEAPPGGGELRLEPPSDEAAEPEPETATATATDEGEPATADETADAGERIAENAAATARALADAAATDGGAADGQTPAGETADIDAAAETDDAPAGGESKTPDAEGAETVPETGEPETAAPAAEVASDRDEAEGTSETGAAAGEPAAGAGETASSEAAAETAPVGAESVIPEGTAGLLTPRNLLLALGVLVLAGLLAVWLRRRQYKPVPADFQAETIGQAGATAPAFDAADRADEAQTASEHSSVPELLADADSYIEHELYDEALAALEVGLEEHPGEPALRRKILEVQYYAGARDAFVEAAERHFPTPDEDDPDWRTVAAMGREIAPDEPRFAGVPAEASPVHGPGAPGPDADTPLFEDDADYASEPSPDSRPDEDWQPETPAVSTVDEPGESDRDDDAFRQADEGEFDLDFDFGTDDAPAAGGGDERSRDDLPEPDTGESREDDAGTAPAASADDDETADGGPGDDAGDRDTASTPPSLDIDLSDFDLGDEETGSAAGDEEQTGADKDETAGDDDEFADFDLDELTLDSDEGGDETRTADKEAVGSDTFGELEEPVGPDESGGDDLELGEGFDLDDADLGREAPASGDTPEETGTAGDEMLSPGTEPEEGDAGIADDETGEPAGASSDADDDEVATQLDLARAYLDMGEPDMARSLLDEVKSKGNAEQRREAEELLGRAG
ncbi:Tfp pilus assembly protein FimV-like protein [Salinisphaera sp. PC39]|uniref:FimV/HubP family polar landmark protein n=1 Tax=Salinisphaera sp. PC39 TaxID=1304156 RepID=UPI00333F6488